MRAGPETFLFFGGVIFVLDERVVRPIDILWVHEKMKGQYCRSEMVGSNGNFFLLTVEKENGELP